LGVFDYDGHCVWSFVLAFEGWVDDVFAELNEGWTVDWSFLSVYVADTVRVRYLVGDYEWLFGVL